jgi:dienelactone hydrolase
MTLLGAFPQKVEPALSLHDTVDRGAYWEKKVSFRAEADDVVPAYLLVPKGGRRCRAVYCHHQHAGNWRLGKSETVGLAGDPDLAYGRELAERGFVVLAPDAIAFEERNRSDGTNAHNLYEMTTRLVQGRTLLAKVLHDVIVGVDVLAALPEVDPERIGFIGHSYGGRMALWSPAVDPRIKASVSHCGCISYADSLAPDAGIQMEFCVPGIVGRLDLDDVVKAIAPRALLVSATEDDRWSRGAARLREACRSGFPAGKFEVKVWPGRHVFTAQMRAYAYAFLGREL